MRGDKTAIVVDEKTGVAHAVNRMLAMAAKSAGTPPVTALEITDRLRGLPLSYLSRTVPARADGN